MEHHKTRRYNTNRFYSPEAINGRNVRDTKVIPNTTADTDHRLVVILMKRNSRKQRKKNTSQSINFTKLKETKAKEKLRAEMELKYEGTENKLYSGVIEAWEQLKHMFHSALKNHCGRRKQEVAPEKKTGW